MFRFDTSRSETSTIATPTEGPASALAEGYANLKGFGPEDFGSHPKSDDREAHALPGRAVQEVILALLPR